MANRLSILNPITIPLLGILLTYLYTFYLHRTVSVVGIFRKADATVIAPEDFKIIEDTPHCEDIHYYEPAGVIFTACEPYVGSRLAWFPPIEHFADPSTEPMKGRLQIIDPKTFKTQRLTLEGFDGPFVTHGIDVISDPAKPVGKAVYIFAINHKPNPEHYGKNGNPETPQAHSVVELFHHVIGSDTAQHIRTIWHPLITTPNDLIVESPTSFYITNDHFYRKGYMRFIEDAYHAARWTSVIHVQLDKSAAADNESKGVKASVALDNIHNSNGIAHGRTAKEALIASCSSGLLHVGQIERNGTSQIINVDQVIQFHTAIDNPTYFSDPYANDTFDASGIVVGGLTRPIEFPTNKELPEALDPSMVMKASLKKNKQDDEKPNWDVNVIFQDDGHRIRTTSGTVLVAIDPKEEGGQRRAWLFVTGFLSKNTIAVKIDL